MELTTQMTIRQIWNDSRLAFKTEDPSLEYVTLDKSLAQMLWTPDLFFNTETSAFIHTIMKPNSYKRIYPDGKVLWSNRITSTFSCPMNFRYFPFDKQMCKITLQSFSETIKDLLIDWDKEILVQFEQKSYSNFGFDLEMFKTGTY
jgi:anionic glutamate receptor